MTKARQQARHPDRKVKRAVVGYVHPFDTVGAHFQRSIAQLLVYDRKRSQLVGMLDETSGAQITTARNKVVKAYLEHDGYADAEWLWLVDADMEFAPDTLERLLDAADPVERPIVGGLCFAITADSEIVHTLFRWDPQQQNLTRPPQYPLDQLVEVDATGAACLLVHRSVFERMAEKHTPPWPWFCETPTGDQWGASVSEDITFCLRAKERGFRVWVDTRVKLGHVKSVVLDEQLFLSSVKQRTAEPPAPIYAVIPVKGRQELTASLLKQLAEQNEHAKVFVFDNGAADRFFAFNTRDLPANRMEVLSADGQTIHQMWNRGIELALADSGGRCTIAFLNNDLNIGPNFLSQLDKGLRADRKILAACPNYDGRDFDGELLQVQSTYKNKGLSGFAFAVRGEAFDAVIPRFDEQFHWYCGDDDLMANIDKVGGLAVLVKSCTVEHIGGGSQTSGDGTKRIARPELQEAIELDLKRMHEKWGHY